MYEYLSLVQNKMRIMRRLNALLLDLTPNIDHFATLYLRIQITKHCGNGSYDDTTALNEFFSTYFYRHQRILNEKDVITFAKTFQGLRCLSF